MIKRYRRKGPQRSTNDAEETNDEEDDDEESLGAENPLLMDDVVEESADGSREKILDLQSLRLDTVTKFAFNMTRAKVEESFYKGHIYLNNERAQKKSVELSQGDEIDFEKQIDTETDSLVVNRVYIVEVPDKAHQSGRIKIKVRTWQDLKIPRRTKE